MNLGLGISLSASSAAPASFTPTSITSLTAMFVSPNYAKVSTTGTWTASVGSNATNGGLNAPAASSGAPDFSGGGSIEGLRCAQNEGALMHMTGTPEGSCFVVCNLDTVPAAAGSPIDNPGFFGQVSRGAVGFGVSANGAIAFAYDGAYQSKEVALATGAVRSACMRFKSGDVVGVKVDGSAWSEAALGTYTPTTTNIIQIGTSYDGLHTLDGRLLAVLFFSTKLTDAEAVNLRTWAQAQFGAA